MDSLKSTKSFRSRIKQFYSDYNSSLSSSSDSSIDGSSQNFFTFDVPQAPKIRPQNGAQELYYAPPVSPGLSRNQDLKDAALDLVYSRKIKDLQSKVSVILSYLKKSK